MDHLGCVITGTVGVDAHVIGTKIISRALRDAGFKVVELGAQTPPEEFIMAAQETAADAMMISSLYGMAELDLEGFRDKCTEAGLEGILLYLGGILGVSRHDFAVDEAKFKAKGFDRVYPPEADVRGAIEDLKGDLDRAGPGARRAGPRGAGREAVAVANTRLFVDFGSTFTKLVAFDLEGEELLGRVQVPSTVVTDITVGLEQAFSLLSETVPIGARRAAADGGLQQRRRRSAGRLRRARARVHHRGRSKGGPWGGGKDRRLVLVRALRGRVARDRGHRPRYRAADRGHRRRQQEGDHPQRGSARPQRPGRDQYHRRRQQVGIRRRCRAVRRFGEERHLYRQRDARDRRARGRGGQRKDPRPVHRPHHRSEGHRPGEKHDRGRHHAHSGGRARGRQAPRRRHRRTAGHRRTAADRRGRRHHRRLLCGQRGADGRLGTLPRPARTLCQTHGRGRSGLVPQPGYPEGGRRNERTCRAVSRRPWPPCAGRTACPGGRSRQPVICSFPRSPCVPRSIATWGR